MKTLNKEPFTLARAHHPISRSDIDPDALKVLYRLSRNGFKAYMVGGAVRDLLLGRKPKDFDVATDARPGQIKKLFANCFLIGRRFRLAHIRFKGNKVIEVATFRKEPELGHEEDADYNNTYGTPGEDAFRRDITINALFYDISTYSIIDFVGGLDDIARKRVTIIGDASERYSEDPVRMWRVLRYASRQGFTIETKTAKAIGMHGDLLGSCSGSRLYEELNKDIASGHTSKIFCAMMDYSLLSVILGKVGSIIEGSPEIKEEFIRLLSVIDDSAQHGNPLTPVVSYGLFFWPWAKKILNDKSELCRDRTKLLTDEFAEAGIIITIPKVLRANLVHAFEILDRMITALKTGKMRWSMTKKTGYGDASRLFALITLNRPSASEDAFLTAFMDKFPQERSPLRHGKKMRRRRYRRRKPSNVQGSDSAL